MPTLSGKALTNEDMEDLEVKSQVDNNREEHVEKTQAVCSVTGTEPVTLSTEPILEGVFGMLSQQLHVAETA